MKITRVRTCPVTYHLKDAPPVGGYGRWPESFQNVLVQVETDEGLTGFGEAPAEKFYLGETPEHVLAGLQVLGEALVGRDAWSLVANLAHLDQFVLGYHGTMSAKYGIDLALHDLLGKACRQPVYRLLGGGYRAEFPMMAHVFYGEPQTMAAEALEAKNRGYRSLEIKAAGLKDSLEGDVARIKAVLDAVSPEVYVCVDANQAWGHPKRVIGILNGEFRGVTNLAIEQPVPYMNLDGMAAIARATEIPVIADESAFSPDAVMQLARMGAADGVSIKLVRVGGIHRAMQIVSICEAAGLLVKLDWLHFSRIGDTATAHIAVNCRYPLAVAVDGHTRFREDPIRAGGLVLRRGDAIVPSGPGLGFEVDEQYLLGCNVKRL